MIPHKMKWISLFLYASILMIACSNDDTPDDDNDEVVITDPDPDVIESVCETGKTPFFIEKDGLIAVEMESSNHDSTPWQFAKNITDYSGNGYLVWNGADSFGQPGNGLLTYKIRITNPGTYRFIWRSRITSGSSNTDFNDNWLRIPDAKHFYGKKGNGHIVYPKGTTLDPIPDSAGQTDTDPEGAGSDGWFKIYMNTLGSWHWQSSTSDNDPHNIYAVFDTVGDYTIEISGRSKGHGIDKFVLFTDTVTESAATDSNVTISEIICQ